MNLLEKKVTIFTHSAHQSHQTTPQSLKTQIFSSSTSVRCVCVFTCELFSFSAQLSPFKIETK